MTRLRAALWALAIAVLSVALAAVLFRIAPLPGAAFAALLALCAGALSFAAALLVELPSAVGLAAGALAAALVAVVLGFTIAAAPLAPGASRPGLSDLLWLPLLALAGTLALCGAAGYFGLRAGLRLSRRRGSAS